MKMHLLLIMGLAVLSAGCRAPRPSAQIIEPTEGATVDQVQMVRGSSRAVPSSQVVWVVVFVHKVGRYYPQNQPADVQPDGGWSSLAYIGIPADVGLKFDVIAVLADGVGERAFASYLVSARDRNDFAGLEQLPHGVTVYDRVSVTRK